MFFNVGTVSQTVRTGDAGNIKTFGQFGELTLHRGCKPVVCRVRSSNGPHVDRLGNGPYILQERGLFPFLWQFLFFNPCLF